MKWIQPARRKLIRDSPGYWESKSQTQAWKTWAGFAFESVCFKHVNKIANALGLGVISKEIGSWRYLPGSKGDRHRDGAQIDLLLDRSDGVINICEIKHYNKKFVIDKSYARELRRKLELFNEQTKTGKQLFLTMITTHGLKQNEYSGELAVKEITLKDLFKKD